MWNQTGRMDSARNVVSFGVVPHCRWCAATPGPNHTGEKKIRAPHLFPSITTTSSPALNPSHFSTLHILPAHPQSPQADYFFFRPFTSLLPDEPDICEIVTMAEEVSHISSLRPVAPALDKPRNHPAL